ncbi:hypothetical protein C0585_06005 [Candidatus Woesearchaeota archaeon]|nr:MAG: hypothetical protein C0585_06005 [Candidatus Woesearchaeota archaeon]
MRPIFHDPTIFYVELIYSAIIIILSLLIFFRTKEIYDLTKHKGIGFFRNTFLFFGLAYFFRFMITAFDISRMTFDFHIRKLFLMPIVLVVVSYLSTMAILSLIFSTTWKNLKMRFIIVANIIAAMLSLVVFFTRSSIVLIWCQTILLIIAIFLSYKKHRKSKRFSSLFLIYVLLFAFWILNMAVISPQKPIPIEFRILQNIISVGIFSFIFYKVKKLIK